MVLNYCREMNSLQNRTILIDFYACLQKKYFFGGLESLSLKIFNSLEQAGVQKIKNIFISS